MRPLLLCLAILTVAPGCQVIHQSPVAAHETGTYVRPVRLSAEWYQVDDAFRDRYNALVAAYGHKRLENGAPVFLPPLEKDDGIQPNAAGSWLMSTTAMENMVVLESLKRRGAAP